MINSLYNDYTTTYSYSGLAGWTIALIVILLLIHLIMICYAITRCKSNIQMIAVLIASLFGFIILGFAIYQLEKINEKTDLVEAEKNSLRKENIDLKKTIQDFQEKERHQEREKLMDKERRRDKNKEHWKNKDSRFNRNQPFRKNK